MKLRKLFGFTPPTAANSVRSSQTLRGKTTCQVRPSRLDLVVYAPSFRRAFLEDSGTGTANGLTYVTSAARVADALTQDVLLTPIEGPQLSADLAPAGRMYVERRTQARSSSVAGDSTPSCHPG